MTRAGLINLFLFTLGGLLGPLALAENTKPAQYSSPDGQYTLKLEQAQNPEPGQYGITITHQKKTISSFNYILEGNIIDVLWNPSCTGFSINNRHSVGGDYVWIFHLPSGVAVKRPDNENVQRTLIKVHEKYPEYSNGNLRSHYTFACKWRSDTELLVCTILLFDKENEALVVAYDTYVMGVDGGYTVSTNSISKLHPNEFNKLPAETTKIWTGWNSTWWKIPGKEPAGK